MQKCEPSSGAFPGQMKTSTFTFTTPPGRHDDDSSDKVNRPMEPACAWQHTTDL